MTEIREEAIAEIRRDLAQTRDKLHQRIRKIRADVQNESAEIETDFEDHAIQRENDEVLDLLEPAARKELTSVLAALERMETGDYGVCEACGDDIGIRRLQALPYARLCIDCAEEAELPSGPPTAQKLEPEEDLLGHDYDDFPYDESEL